MYNSYICQTQVYKTRSKEQVVTKLGIPRLSLLTIFFFSLYISVVVSCFEKNRLDKNLANKNNFSTNIPSSRSCITKLNGEGDR